jgi:hypothetical protein
MRDLRGARVGARVDGRIGGRLGGQIEALKWRLVESL